MHIIITDIYTYTDIYAYTYTHTCMCTHTHIHVPPASRYVFLFVPPNPRITRVSVACLTNKNFPPAYMRVDECL